jgi:selenium-dependent xanthine dehydrogenase
MAQTISLNVNNKLYEIKSLPGETLAEVLRNRLNLTGTKVGCGEAECGSCTVVIDGQAVMSCVYPAERAQGKHVTTIEGLSQPDGRRHPLQDAFIKHGAVQCGFCIPGQIMTAYALLESNPDPTSAEIRSALKDTLCRCAGYPSIENAILEAACSVRTGEPISGATVPDSESASQVIGRSVIRPDAVAKVTGSAIYTDDLKFEKMLYAAVCRAGVPHAILREVDIEGAFSVPGVVAVLTAKDIPGDKNHGLVIFDWPTMIGIGERIRTVGDTLAIVAAESQDAANDAVGRIGIHYDELPVVNDPVQARQPDTPALHEKGNLLKHIKVRKGDMEKGFREAEVIVEHTFHTPSMDHAFLEPECSIAVPLPNGRMEIYVGSQIPYSDRSQVAGALGWPEERVRVIGQLMGGGFGGKEDIAGQIQAALLANATGRPVKLLYSRHDSLIAHPKRHATQIRVKIGAKRDGQLVAIETELYGDTGAYASLGEKVMTRATTHSAGPYEVENVRADCYAMYTNNPPAGAYRGFGVLQSAFAVESMMDMLAGNLRIDPVELRRMNALHVGSITNTGQELRESVGLLDCINRVDAEMRKYSSTPFTATHASGEGGRVRAWGFAAAYKNTGLGGGAPDKSGAEVQLYPDGSLEVRTSAAELGQGLVTVLRMIVAEEFSLPPERVRVLVMDTDLTPDGGPTTASRQTYVTGNAARLAARYLRKAVTSFLTEKFDVAPESVRYIEGFAKVNEQCIALGEIASDMQASGIAPRALYEYSAPSTMPLGEGGDMHFAFSFAAQAAEVEVNKDSGEVRVLRVISANDVGRAINPLGLRGQVEGGVMMGLGNTITEHFIVEDGRVITNRMAKYRIPSIVHMPEIIPIIVEHPTQDGPYGAKGVGEVVTIPTPAAITNAIYNAVGVRIDSLPVDQEQILKAIQTQVP